MQHKYSTIVLILIICIVGVIIFTGGFEIGDGSDCEINEMIINIGGVWTCINADDVYSYMNYWETKQYQTNIYGNKTGNFSLHTTGRIIANMFIGNGSLLTGINATSDNTKLNVNGNNSNVNLNLSNFSIITTSIIYANSLNISNGTTSGNSITASNGLNYYYAASQKNHLFYSGDTRIFAAGYNVPTSTYGLAIDQSNGRLGIDGIGGDDYMSNDGGSNFHFHAGGSYIFDSGSKIAFDGVEIASISGGSIGYDSINTNDRTLLDGAGGAIVCDWAEADEFDCQDSTIYAGVFYDTSSAADIDDMYTTCGEIPACETDPVWANDKAGGVSDTYDDGVDTTIQFSSGLATSISTAYDINLMKEIRYMSLLNPNVTLIPVLFKWNNVGIKQFPSIQNKTGVQMGYIAQDVLKYYPECVRYVDLKEIENGRQQLTGEKVLTYDKNCVMFKKLLKIEEECS